MSKELDKLKFHGDNSFDYRYRTGDVGDVMKRYGIGATRSAHPDGRSGKPRRTASQVDSEIAAAMKNDYDTRRTMEAAALAGNNDAKKYAKKGYNPDNIWDANETIGDLEKEYGKEYGAGLTFAAVNSDRKALTKNFTAMSAQDQEKAARGTTPENVEPSEEVLAAKERVAAWQASNGMTNPGPYAERSTKFF